MEKIKVNGPEGKRRRKKFRAVGKVCVAYSRNDHRNNCYRVEGGCHYFELREREMFASLIMHNYLERQYG